MPHYRRFWKKFTTSEEVNEMPDDTTRLAWAVLPTALDREGRGLDSAAWLRAQLFPLRDDITVKKVRDMMDWWAEHAMIIRYEVDGKKCIVCPTFHAHQGDCLREAKSEIPPPPHDLCTTFARPMLAEVLTNSGTEAKAEAGQEAQALQEARQEVQAEQDPVAVALSALSALRLPEPIGDKRRKQLASEPFMTPGYIEAVYRKWKRKPGSGVGLLITMLASGEVPKGGNGDGDDWKRFE